MRCIVKANIPVETGNDTIRSGKLQKTIQSIVKELKPEAAYFYAERGQRTAIFVFDLKDPSQIPMIAEPLFLGLNAAVEISPAMNLDDLMKAGKHIENAVQKYT